MKIMNHLITQKEPSSENSDCLIIPVLANRTLASIGKVIDSQTEGQLSRIISTKLIAELGETLMLYEPNHLAAQQVLLVSCGNIRTLSNTQFKILIDSAATALKNQNIHSACCYLEDFPTHNSLAWKTTLAVQQFEAILYRFENFKTQNIASTKLETLYFHNDTDDHTVQDALTKGIAIAKGMHITKDLANTPANHATPTKVAEYAQKLTQDDTCLEVTILDKKNETIQKMGGFLAVAQGSIEPPQFVVVKYTPTQLTHEPPIVLVGKGITFDTGGISLKPSDDMEEMKFDMAGAASVLGILYTISQLQVSTPVVGLLPLAENLPSGSAFKPGDIITTLSGQTVEILNTDAEGRLILADALTYSRELNPAVVIDVATLTGAVVVALGENTTGLMTTDTELSAHLETASVKSVDHVWALPLWEEYQKLINSNVADMANLGSKGAGSITAGCFLARFTKGMRWAHLDIGGTANTSGQNKTATGRPVPLLVQYILDYCESSTT